MVRGRVPPLAITHHKSKIENRRARVAELADAPDLGFRNHRVQNVSSRFKKRSIYEGKTHFITPNVVFTNDEQKSARSSTRLVHRRARLGSCASAKHENSSALAT